jgi:cytochrome o ubiquinol oxidase operon protein cyoD
MSADHAHAHHDHHDDHGGSHDHGSLGSYMKGFVLSVILTAIPFAIVMAGGFESRGLTALVIIGFAVVQILVHMVYFLHMTGNQEEGWTMMSTIFTLVVVVILLAGSIWVMYHMNTNMMPQMDHEAMQGFGS